MPKRARRARNGHGAHQSGRSAHEMARRVAFRRTSVQERIDRERRDCYRVAWALPRSFAGQSVSLRKSGRLRRPIRLRRQLRLRLWPSLSLPRLEAPPSSWSRLPSATARCEPDRRRVAADRSASRLAAALANADFLVLPGVVLDGDRRGRARAEQGRGADRADAVAGDGAPGGHRLRDLDHSIWSSSGPGSAGCRGRCGGR